VVGQATWLAHWWQKVGGQLLALPNRLRRQWLYGNAIHGKTEQISDI